MTRQRHKGDRYRPIVTIVKLKNGTIPTVIQVSGRTYILRHEDTKPPRRQTAKNGPYSPDDVREGKTTDQGVVARQNRNMGLREGLQEVETTEPGPDLLRRVQGD